MSQRDPSIAAGPSGGFVVVWQSDTQDDSGFGIFGQRLASDGSLLGAEFRVNTYTSGNEVAPSIASDPSGNFIVVWQSETQDGSGFGIFGQRFASGGARLGAEFRVNTYTTGIQRFSSVASDSSGRFLVVWQSEAQDGSDFGIFGQRYASGGAPLGAEFRVNTFTTYNELYPSVAALAAGSFVVVWQNLSQDGYTYGVFGQRYGSGGAPLGSEFQVNSYTTDRQGYAVVASDATGRFVVVWHSYFQDGSYFGIFGQRYASDGSPLGAEFRVNTYTPSSQVEPSVASDSAGNFVVVWQGNMQDGSYFGAFGQRYSSDGSPLGVEFRVNAYTTYTQRYPDVIFGSNGDFVVVWEGDVQDGSSYGIFGQRHVLSIGCVAPDLVAPSVTPSIAIATPQTVCQ